MIKIEIERIIKAVIEEKFGQLDNVSFEVESPKQIENGDYASSAAMVLAKRLGKNPRELAEEIAEEIRRFD